MTPRKPVVTLVQVLMDGDCSDASQQSPPSAKPLACLTKPTDNFPMNACLSHPVDCTPGTVRGLGFRD